IFRGAKPRSHCHFTGAVMRSLRGWGLVLALFPLSLRALAAQERTTVGGYGEIHYTDATGPNTPAEINLKRFVVYLAHSFTDQLVFRSELEVEDAKIEGGQAGGEVALEQAYLDYRVRDWLTVRTGLVLPPVGIINETHEPPTFNGVDRPGFDHPSLTGRLEWTRPGLKLGAALWYGGTANGDTALGTGSFAAPVVLLAADVRYDVGAASFRGVAANISVSDAAAIDRRYGTAVGSRIAGGYLEAAYNVLHLLAPASSQKLAAFVRHERYDTQADVPAGVTRDRALARRLTTAGLTYKPTWNTAFKG